MGTLNGSRNPAKYHGMIASAEALIKKLCNSSWSPGPGPTQNAPSSIEKLRWGEIELKNDLTSRDSWVRESFDYSPASQDRDIQSRENLSRGRAGLLRSPLRFHRDQPILGGILQILEDGYPEGGGEGDSSL